MGAFTYAATKYGQGIAMMLTTRKIQTASYDLSCLTSRVAALPALRLRLRCRLLFFFAVHEAELLHLVARLGSGGGAG